MFLVIFWAHMLVISNELYHCSPLDYWIGCRKSQELEIFIRWPFYRRVIRHGKPSARTFTSFDSPQWHHFFPIPIFIHILFRLKIKTLPVQATVVPLAQTKKQGHCTKRNILKSSRFSTLQSAKELTILRYSVSVILHWYLNQPKSWLTLIICCFFHKVITF